MTMIKKILFVLIVYATGFYTINAQTIKPNKPTITSISYDNGRYIINWNKNNTSVNSYKVNIPVGSNSTAWKTIQTISGQALPTYIIDSMFENYNLNNFAYYFEIQAELNGVLSDQTRLQNTDSVKILPTNILLTGSYNKCDNTIRLNWNKFNGWPNGSPNSFILYVTEGNGKPVQVGSSNFNDTARSIILPKSAIKNFSIKTNVVYTFQIRTQFDDPNENWYCNSNLVKISTTNDIFPSYINAQGTDARSNDSIKLSFSIDPNSNLTRYKLICEGDTSLNKTLKINSGSQIDYFVHPSNTNYNIKFKLIGLSNDLTCNKSNTESNFESYVILSKPTRELNNVILNWSNYFKFNGTFDKYSIYRVRNGETLTIGTCDTTKLTFTDNIGPNNGENNDGIKDKKVYEELYYYVSADEINNPFNTNGKAYSNTVKVIVKSEPKPPSYFSPNSNKANKIWEIPDCVSGNYLLIIYDRWGTKVFEKNDYKWDGNYQNSGSPAPHGEYIYYFKITDSDGKSSDIKGTFTLLRNK
jgi:gliding motility-associated-like protein